MSTLAARAEIIRTNIFVIITRNPVVAVDALTSPAAIGGAKILVVAVGVLCTA